jgi:DNA-binding transcriptional ArsR family regulator
MFTFDTFEKKRINTFLNKLLKVVRNKKGERRKMSAKLYSEREYESILIKTLGDSPKLRIVDFFLDNPLFDFTKKEVIEALGMSKQTFYKYFPELEEYGIVKVSRKIGRAKLYRINVEHPLVKMLRDYETKMSKEMAEKAKMKKPILA